MHIKDKVVVVTGGASGIGKSLSERFAREGARAVIVSDINQAGVDATVADIAALTEARGIVANVGKEDEVSALVDATLAEFGHIDLFCSNAGISIEGGVEVDDTAWQRIWDINVMAHVWAARHLVPLMAARGGGYLLNTASAAGLLNQVGSAPYGVTKHAAVGLAEWLALTYGDQGIKVSVLCPQAVRTEMTRGHEGHVAALDGMMEPAPVADACVQAIEQETFLVLPHPQVAQYMRNKTDGYDRWIKGMRKLNRRFGVGAA